MATNDSEDKYTCLISTIRRLRGKDGCPWDRKQTPESIKKYIVEEVNELAEAIDAADHNHIKEEIGDVFFTLIMLIIMHEEQGIFSGDDVLDAITAKMIRRHPHVFAGLEAGSEEQLNRQWQDIKKSENEKDY